MAADVVSYTFTWKIDIFAFYKLKTGEFIKSPTFVFENLNSSNWYLKLYPKGPKQEYESFASIFLRKDDEGCKEVTIDYTIRAFDGSGEELKHLATKDEVFTGKIGRGWNEFIKSDDISERMCNWKDLILTICCEISSKIPDKPLPSGCEAVTKAGTDTCVIDWDLPLPSSDSTKWTKTGTFAFLPVSIAITLSLSADEDKVQIHIRKTDVNSVESRLVFCKLSLLDTKKAIVISKCDSHLFQPQDDSGMWEFPSFLTKQLLEDDERFLQSNRFTLKCELSIPNGTVTSHIENFIFPPPLGGKSEPEANMITSLQRKLSDLFAVKKHCDVDFKVGESTISAHKCTLAARSPVFSSMFDTNMLENKTGVVEIKDISANTMNSLLQFLYSGSLKELDYESASELILAANKYQNLYLIEKCSSFLSSSFSVCNVCDVLVVADMIGYNPLKESAIFFIIENRKEMMVSPNWKEWVKDNNLLATEVLLKLPSFLEK